MLAGVPDLILRSRTSAKRAGELTSNEGILSRRMVGRRRGIATQEFHQNGSKYLLLHPTTISLKMIEHTNKEKAPGAQVEK